MIWAGIPVAGESGFEVQAQALRTHAGGVDQVADAVEQARSAAVSVHLGRAAYGRLCQLIPSVLDPVQEGAVSALREAVGALQQMAGDVRDTARNYETSDQHAAGLFGGGEER
jgi:hypothetical protein